MNIWALSDPHLCFGNPEKSMESFGKTWENYSQKIDFSYVKIKDIILKNQFFYEKKSNKKIDFLILNNIHKNFSKRCCLQFDNINTKIILIVWEPPTVHPWMHNNLLYKSLDRIITWNDDLIDNKKNFPFKYPVCRPMINNIKDFESKKFLSTFIANKRSSYKDENYTNRRKILEFYNTTYPLDFDLYGPGWKKSYPRIYKGYVKDKIDCLRNYKFAYCFENTINIKGYITEKIFHCMYSGSIPIYYGASNIQDYIPSDCFIDFRDFENIENLDLFLRKMTKSEYEGYINRIREFLISGKGKIFTSKHLVNSLKIIFNSYLNQDNDTQTQKF